MDARSRSAEFLRRSDELQTQSARTRAAAAQRHATAAQMVDESTRLIAAATKAREAVLRACGGDPARRAFIPVARSGSAATVVLVAADPGGVWLDAGQLQAVRQQARELRQKSQETIARARAARERASRGRSQRQILQDSAYARLLARQQTIGVIEQAKGIIVAHQGCGPEEAFDLLRRASQRTNVKVRDLAAEIVEHVAASGTHGNVAPIALGTRRYQHPRNGHGHPPDDPDSELPGRGGGQLGHGLRHV